MNAEPPARCSEPCTARRSERCSLGSPLANRSACSSRHANRPQHCSEDVLGNWDKCPCFEERLVGPESTLVERKALALLLWRETSLVETGINRVSFDGHGLSNGFDYAPSRPEVLRVSREGFCG